MRVVRSQSAFGFSMIYVIFEDDVDLYFARARVLERMSLVDQGAARRASTPTLGPDATGVGHVFWYTRREPDALAARAAHPAGLVHPLPAERRARRRRSRLGRRLRPAVPDRRRSQPAARTTTCRCSAVVDGGARQQPQRRRQRPRVERRLADRPRRRPDRVGRRRQAHRRSARRTACRSTSSRSPTCSSATPSAWPRWSRARRKPSAASSSRAPASTRKALIDAVKARIAQIAAGPAGGRDDRAVLRPLRR